MCYEKKDVSATHNDFCEAITVDGVSKYKITEDVHGSAWHLPFTDY